MANMVRDSKRELPTSTLKREENKTTCSRAMRHKIIGLGQLSLEMLLINSNQGLSLTWNCPILISKMRATPSTELLLLLLEKPLNSRKLSRPCASK